MWEIPKIRERMLLTYIVVLLERIIETEKDEKIKEEIKKMITWMNVIIKGDE